MPRAPENGRHMHLYGDAAPARCMGGMLNMFDWNIATLRGKKLLADLEFPDGLEAPRNSLDITSSGVVGGKDDGPRTSTGSGSSTKADIPYGFKAAKPAIPGRELPKCHEKRLGGGPGVIARLMGLDALPDAAPSAAERPTVLHAKGHKEKIPVARRLLKDVKALRAQSSDQSRFSSPDSRAGKESVNRDDVSSPVMGRRDPAGRTREHPQEKQLQEFKRQFQSRMGMQSGQEWRLARQSDSNARQVQDKRVVVVEDGINEARAERSRREDGPRQLEAALKKFNKSTGVQEILEVLQSNKDFCEALHSNKEFFLNYLQDPMPLDKHHLLEPVPEENTYTPPPPIEVRKPKDESDTKRKVSEKKKKGGISPSAFARRFIDLRRESKSEPKEKPSTSKSQPQTEENTPTTTPRASTSLLPRFRGRSRSKSADNEKSAVTVSEDLVSGQNCFVNSFKADTHSPGNIVLLRPGSTESSGMSSPASVVSYSPSLSKSRKDLTWRGEMSAAEAGKGRQQHELEEETTPKSERSRTSGWDRGPSGEDLPRHSREVARQRDAHDEVEANGSRDRMAIARDIIREARASARESTKSQPSIATGDSGHFTASRRTSRLGSERGDGTGNSDGDITPRSISRLSAASPSESSTVVPSPGVSSLSRPLVSLVNFSSSPRPSQDLARTQALSEQGHQQRRDGDKQQDQRKTFPDNYSNSSSRPGGSPRSSRPAGTSSQVSSRVLRKAIAGSLIENWIIDSRNPHHDSGAISLPPVPEKEHVLRVASVATSAASQSEEESVCSSPKSVTSNLSLQRCRSVPNAALVRDSRSRGEQQQPHPAVITDGRWPETQRAAQPSHEPALPEPVAASSGGRPFAESYKRGVEAVGSLFARAKSKERNKIFVRSRKKKDAPTADEPRSIVPVSPTPDQNLQSVSSSCPSSAAGPVLPPAEHVSAPATTDGSNTFPGNHKDEHELAAKDRWDPKAREGKRVSFSGDIRWGSEREEASSELSNVGSQSPAEMPSILSPCMQRVRMNADMATDQCLADAIITTDILEVSAGPQSPRSPKVCSIATDTPQRKEDEHDTGGEKGGQPSPISVLDSPFEVDSPDPSPEESDEVSSDLQDLRLRLRILKLDGNARPRLNNYGGGARDSHEAEVQVVNRQLFARESDRCEELEGCQSACAVPSPKSSIPTVIPTVEADVESQRALLEGIDLEGFPCSRDCEEDLVYVRNLLVASEFVESSTKLFMRWHSPGQPLDPILFENLEDYYDRSGCAAHVVVVDGKEEGSEGGPHVRTRHRVLFDAVNEVLLRKLGPYLNFRPWLHPDTPLLRPIPIGRVLVWDTWMELRDFFPSCGADASSFLLRQDLGRRREWDGSMDNFQEVGLQLEKNIFEDLVDEAVQCLTYGRPKQIMAV